MVGDEGLLVTGCAGCKAGGWQLRMHDGSRGACRRVVA